MQGLQPGSVPKLIVQEVWGIWCRVNDVGLHGIEVGDSNNDGGDAGKLAYCNNI